MDKPSSKHLVTCVRYYLELCLAKGQSSHTVRGKQSDLKKFQQWCVVQDITLVTQIDLDIIDEYMEYLNAFRKPLDGQPLSQSHKRNLLTAIKILMITLYKKGIIKRNKLEHIELPSAGRPLPKAIFSQSEIDKILAQTLLYGVIGIRDRVILETFFASGVRRNELLHFKLEDVNFAGQLLRVNHGKGRKERIVPISQRACEWLALYIKKIRPMLAIPASGNILFLANQGGAFEPGKLSDMASKYVRLAGIRRPGSCHLFRHTTATMMLDNGADLRHVQEMLGHEHISSTEIYTHVSREKLSHVYKLSHPSAFANSGLFKL